MKSERQGCAAALLKAGRPQASAPRSAGHDRQGTLLRTSASRKACERLGLEQIGTELYIFRKKCKRGAGAISRSRSGAALAWKHDLCHAAVLRHLGGPQGILHCTSSIQPMSCSRADRIGRRRRQQVGESAEADPRPRNQQTTQESLPAMMAQPKGFSSIRGPFLSRRFLFLFRKLTIFFRAP